MRLLVIRNDKIGDFVSSLPVYQLHKTVNPDIHLTVLVSAYTAELAQACPWIDAVLIDKQEPAFRRNIGTLTRHFKQNGFDAVITLFSTTRIGLAVFLARIPFRLAPATKLAQIFHNHRLRQHRSRSKKPEYEYNLELARYFLATQGYTELPTVSAPFLQFDQEIITCLADDFRHQHDIAADHKLVFLHAGSGGSSNNLGMDQYAQLASTLESTTGHTLVLTAGPQEGKKIETLASELNHIDPVVYHSQQGLLDFARHIAFADVFISGSTGPLHIAGALNVPTAAFYSRRRSATALRWQTLNTPERRLAFSPPSEAAAEDMSSIDVNAAADKISRHFLQSAAPPAAS